MNCLNLVESITEHKGPPNKQFHRHPSPPVRQSRPIESLPPIPRAIFINSEEHPTLICPSLKDIYDSIFSNKSDDEM